MNEVFYGVYILIMVVLAAVLVLLVLFGAVEARGKWLARLKGRRSPSETLSPEQRERLAAAFARAQAAFAASSVSCEEAARNMALAAAELRSGGWLKP